MYLIPLLFFVGPIVSPAAPVREVGRDGEAGRDVITGVSPYLAGRGTVHYIFWASSED